MLDNYDASATHLNDARKYSEGMGFLHTLPEEKRSIVYYRICWSVKSLSQHVDNLIKSPFPCSDKVVDTWGEVFVTEWNILFVVRGERCVTDRCNYKTVGWFLGETREVSRLFVYEMTGRWLLCQVRRRWVWPMELEKKARESSCFPPTHWLEMTMKVHPNNSAPSY